jgi:hypothetical protein
MKNLGEATGSPAWLERQAGHRFELFEPFFHQGRLSPMKEGRVLKSPGASFRFF